MFKYIVSLFCAAIIGTAGAFALDVTTTAGNLASKVADPASVTELKLTGTVNADDLKFIDNAMPALKTLDLSDVSIVAQECFIPGMSGSCPANTIPDHTFAGSSIESVVFPSSSFSLGSGAFAGSALKSLELPLSTANVGDGCFSGCVSLESVTIKGGTLGVGTFAGCASLRTVSVGISTSLPANTFSNCGSLTSISGAGNISAVGDRAFAHCSSLAAFGFGANLTSIGYEAFIGAGLQSADMSGCGKLKTIGGWAFARMPRLESLAMPASAVMSEGMVFDCPSLVNVSISGETTEIPDYAYAKNTAMDTTGMVHDDITAIGNHALHGMSQVESFSLPSGLQYIGDGAMQNMTGLHTLNVSSSTRPEIGEDVWKGVNQPNVKLMVPKGQYGDYANADQWREFNVLDVLGAEDAVMETVENLKGRFVGDELQISISGIDIDRISVYDPAGMLLVSAEPSGDFVALDMSGFQSRVYIVNAALADGRTASLKIAK